MTNVTPDELGRDVPMRVDGAVIALPEHPSVVGKGGRVVIDHRTDARPAR